eukprot:TRINITY_DN72965_c0_g1_i1.p1 TRINITY_DN72965_c0_g1~~TRINITY_DN72965_c0_g1_i1.p1  ORF type:complete len:691 (+),score=73.77 TRINITY_DN72965_c0_g1_i1:30-2075(+)
MATSCSGTSSSDEEDGTVQKFPGGQETSSDGDSSDDAPDARRPWTWLWCCACAGVCATALWFVWKFHQNIIPFGQSFLGKVDLPAGSTHVDTCEASWSTKESNPAFTCTWELPTCVGFKSGEQWGRCVRTCTASHGKAIGDPVEIGYSWVGSQEEVCPPKIPVCSKDGFCVSCGSLKDEAGCNPEICKWQMGRCMTLPWNSQKVERICASATESTWRRLEDIELLAEKDEMGEDEEASRRQLRTAANFNSKFLSRIDVGTGVSMTYYGSADLIHDVPIYAVTAVVSIHGARRDAQNYFCSGLKMVDVAGLNNNETILIVPKFTYKVDERQKHDLWWNGSLPNGAWHVGADSDIRSGGQMSSFEVLDQIILYLSNEKFFPFLRDILMVGHSAGGQTLMRYSLLTRLLPANEASRKTYLDGASVRPEVTVTFAIANPSTYAYLDANRWSYNCGSNESPTGCTEPVYQVYTKELGRKGWKPKEREPGRKPRPGGFNDPHLAPWTIGTPFICKSSSFNSYQYGLDLTKTPLPYLRSINLPKQLERYPSRNIIFIVGQNDTCTDENLPFCYASCWRTKQHCFRHKMDMHCPAMLQGQTRYHRGVNFMRHLFFHYGRQVHRLFVVPGTGHQAEKMFLTAAQVKRKVVAEQHELHVTAGGFSIGSPVVSQGVHADRAGDGQAYMLQIA